MVSIGRALMSNPEVLLCDELSLGLAPIVIREIYEAMPAITREGMTVVIVEQDVTMAQRVSKRIYCLQEGRVSLQGRSDALSREQISAGLFRSLNSASTTRDRNPAAGHAAGRPVQAVRAGAVADVRRHAPDQHGAGRLHHPRCFRGDRRALRWWATRRCWWPWRCCRSPSASATRCSATCSTARSERTRCLRWS